MAANLKSDDKKSAVQELRSAGYRVSKPGKYVKYTANVHKDTLTEFKKTLGRLNYMAQDAVTEALDMWLERYKDGQG